MKFGLIGADVSKSYSKAIHEHLKVYSYDLISINQDELKDFMHKKEFTGINVTIPYKRTILDFCDSLTAAARNARSVNTVVKFKNGALIGFNTDFFGIVYLLGCNHVSVKNKTCLILGHGGSGSTAVNVLKYLGASKILVASRQKELPDFKDANVISYDEIPLHQDISVVLNATPMGTSYLNECSLFNISDLKQCKYFFDFNYGNDNNIFANEAAANNIFYSDGLPMLVAQALKSASLFTYEKIDFDLMIDYTLQHIRRTMK